MLGGIKSVARVGIALLAFASLTACSGGDRAKSELTGWRKEVGQVRMGINAGEEDSETVQIWTVYRAYLERVIGLPVKIFQASDYNGIIQAVASGQVELAQLAPASYANADSQVGDKVMPILTRRSADGMSGYYSVFLVRADSPYRTIDDLAGKSIGYVDFNSTSGYLYPRWALRQQGKEPDQFFGKTAMSGGHTQSVLGLENGQFDAIALVAGGGTPSTGFTTGGLYQLGRRGIIDVKDFRVVWTAGPMPNSAIVVRSELPQEFRDIVAGAMAALPYDEPELWAQTKQSAGWDLIPTSRENYRDIIEMRNVEIATRRSGGAKQ